MVRLYRGQVPKLANEVVATLIRDGHLDVESVRIPEVERDVGSVIEEYIRADLQVLNQAKDILSARRQSRESLGRLRRELAEGRNHQLGDEGLRWVQHQIIEALIASNNVEEVYADDVTLLREIRAVFDRVMVSEEVLDSEVRGRMKNLDEGTSAWELQYRKLMQEIRRKHGLTSRV